MASSRAGTRETDARTRINGSSRRALQEARETEPTRRISRRRRRGRPRCSHPMSGVPRDAGVDSELYDGAAVPLLRRSGRRPLELGARHGRGRVVLVDEDDEAVVRDRGRRRDCPPQHRKRGKTDGANELSHQNPKAALAVAMSCAWLSWDRRSNSSLKASWGTGAHLRPRRRSAKSRVAVYGDGPPEAMP